MAEREGFEPSETCASAVFKTAALNHSTISPVETFYLMLIPLSINSVTFLTNAAVSLMGLPSERRAWSQRISAYFFKSELSAEDTISFNAGIKG